MDAPLQERVRRAVDAYLATIAEHTNVFLLLVRHRVAGDADPLADGKAAIAAAIVRTLSDTLRASGVDTRAAEPWAHGLVGLGPATGEWWLTRQTMSREAVGDYLTAFVWHAFDGIARSHGVVLDGAGLRLAEAP